MLKQIENEVSGSNLMEIKEILILLLTGARNAIISQVEQWALAGPGDYYRIGVITRQITCK